MQAQKDAPPEPCRCKVLIQSVIAPVGSTNKDITQEMFIKEDGWVWKDFKMRVIYIPANPPSSVHEGSEEGTPPRASSQENGNQIFEKAWSAISAILKLTHEKVSALQQNQRLRQEMEMMRKDNSKSRSGGFSLMFVVQLVGLLGVLIGYLVKRA